MTGKWARVGLIALSVTLGLGSIAEAAGVLTIGRREDGTTFDPIATAQNVDFWVFSNVYDVLVRVDKTGTKLEPGLAESWEISEDGLTYTFHLRDANFSDGSPITAEDAAFTLLRIRDSELSLWSDSYAVIETAEATDPKTLVVKLKTPSAPFLSTMAMPAVSILSKAGVEAMGEEAYAEKPVASGAFTVKEWRRGDRVILKKNPEFWQADRVSLDGVEWISIPDDNSRMLSVQAGELDAAIFVPFSRVAELKKDTNLKVMVEPSTREDHLLLNHEHEPLNDPKVREAIDLAIDKQAIVDTVTFGQAQIANSYIPAGALYHNDNNLLRPHDPEKAKALLAEAGVSDVSLDYVVNAGNEGGRADRRPPPAAAGSGRDHGQSAEDGPKHDLGHAGEWRIRPVGHVLDERHPRSRPEDHLRSGSRRQHELHDALRKRHGEAARGRCPARDGPGQARGDVYRDPGTVEGRYPLDRPLLQPLHQRDACQYRELQPEPAGPLLPRGYGEELRLRLWRTKGVGAVRRPLLAQTRA